MCIRDRSIDAALRKQLDALNTSVESRETGSVIQVGDGIARVDGLKNAMPGELLEFTSSTGRVVYGMAQNLEEDEAVSYTHLDVYKRQDRKPACHDVCQHQR